MSLLLPSTQTLLSQRTRKLSLPLLLQKCDQHLFFLSQIQLGTPLSMCLPLPPVSYTHLDVYKRQDNWNTRIIMPQEESTLTGATK